MGKLNQRDRILAMLQAAWPADVPAPVLSKIALQFGARLKELRAQGWLIVNQQKVVNGVRHSAYRLGSLTSSDHTKALQQAFELIGVSGSAATLIKLREVSAELAQVQSAARDQQNSLFGLRNGYGDVTTSADKLQGQLGVLQAREKELTQQQINLEQTFLGEKFKEDEQAATKASIALQRYGDLMLRVRQEFAKIQTIQSTLPDKIPSNAFPLDLSALPGSTMPLFSGTAQAQELFKLETDQAARLTELSQLYSDTRTSAENYAFQLTKLNVLYGDKSSEEYQRDLLAIKERFDSVTIAEEHFANEAGQAFAQVLFQGGSLHDLLKTLLLDFVKLIVEAEVLPSLMNGSTGGALLGKFVAGIFGIRGMGGPVSAGVPYIVGEKGPEVFVPSVSGMIQANGAAGAGGTIIYNMDNRGADPSVIPRMERALRDSENRAFQRSVRYMQESRLRT